MLLAREILSSVSVVNIIVNKYELTDFDEEYKNQETQEEENEDDNDANMLFVEQKFCTVCNIEQPLRTKH